MAIDWWKKKLVESRLAVSHHKKGASLRSEKAPIVCPWCGGKVTRASKDENGLWTWNCFDGCNP